MAKPLTDVRGSDGERRFEPEPRTSVSGNTRRHADCLAYFITFHTYGSWLHGTSRGSVDRDHNIPGTELLPADVIREQTEFMRLKRLPVHLDARQRPVIEEAIREVCRHRGWQLHAIAVRTNHVHAVVTAPPKPERVMNDFKAWTTRRLVEATLFAQGARVWSRHGSTPYLWTEEAVQRACAYVIEGQGAVLPSEPLPSPGNLAPPTKTTY